MSLTRREILEELGRLGLKSVGSLKKACREYESYWQMISNKRTLD